MWDTGEGGVLIQGGAGEMRKEGVRRLHFAMNALATCTRANVYTYFIFS